MDALSVLAMSKDKRKKLDYEVFAIKVAEGATNIAAYRAAGGKSTGDEAKKASSRLRKRPDVDVMIKDNIYKLAMSTQVELVSLAPAALQVRRDILENKETLEDGSRIPKNYSDKMRKDVSDAVLADVQKILPKQIQTQVVHEVGEGLDELIEQLIEGRPSEVAKLIEGEVVEESGADEEASGELGPDSDA